MVKFEYLHEVNKRNTYGYLHGVFTETWEDLLISFSHRDMDGMYGSYYDSVDITTHIHVFRVQRLMVDGGSNLIVLFIN